MISHILHKLLFFFFPQNRTKTKNGLSTDHKNQMRSQVLTSHQTFRLLKSQSNASTSTPTLPLKPQGHRTSSNNQVISVKYCKLNESQSQFCIQVSRTRKDERQNYSHPDQAVLRLHQLNSIPAKKVSILYLPNIRTEKSREGKNYTERLLFWLNKQDCVMEVQVALREQLGAQHLQTTIY